MSQYIAMGKYSYGSINIKVSSLKHNQNVKVKIGKFCSIAENVVAEFRNHRLDLMSTYPLYAIKELDAKHTINMTGGHKGDIVIGNDVWIGRDVTLLTGVSIGDGAVIGAETLVSKSVEPYAIVGGNPAKLLRYRFSKEEIDFLKSYKWWDLPIGKIKRIVDIMIDPNWINFKDRLLAIYKRGVKRS